MIEYKMRRHALLASLRIHARGARARLALNPGDLEHLAEIPPGSVIAVEDGSPTDLVVPDLQRLALTLGLTEEGRCRPLQTAQQAGALGIRSVNPTCEPERLR